MSTPAIAPVPKRSPTAFTDIAWGGDHQNSRRQKKPCSSGTGTRRMILNIAQLRYKLAVLADELHLASLHCEEKRSWSGLASEVHTYAFTRSVFWRRR